MIDVPEPNVSILEECQLLPVEFGYRDYLTGSTRPSIWTAYVRGEHRYFGHDLPQGMEHHERLSQPLLTPITKGELGAHDELTSREEIIAPGTLTDEIYAEAERITSALFEAEIHFAKGRGLKSQGWKLSARGRCVQLICVQTYPSNR